MGDTKKSKIEVADMILQAMSLQHDEVLESMRLTITAQQAHISDLNEQIKWLQVMAKDTPDA